MPLVLLTKEQAEAACVALDYYLDTLDPCHRHDDGEHGDESDCEGWGPKEHAALQGAALRIGNARRE